jgi:hypothetical protein
MASMGLLVNSGSELNPHGVDLQQRQPCMKARKHRRRSELEDTCPRGEPDLTYMIDIALTTEFAIHAGGERHWALE